MNNAWKAQADSALEQFNHQPHANHLLHAIQHFRVESIDKSTVQRREILDAGRPLALRAAEALEGGQLDGDIVGLMVEAGLYLVECARSTVAESNLPLELIPEMQKPEERLGPQLMSEDFLSGIKLMTQGFARGMATGDGIDQLKILRGYIVDYASGLLLPTGDFDKDSERLSLLCWIAFELEDYLLFTQATTELSVLLRNAKQPKAAEEVVRKSLEWPLLRKKQRNQLKVELASALSEQGRFPEAEAIQRELLVE